VIDGAFVIWDGTSGYIVLGGDLTTNDLAALIAASNQVYWLDGRYALTGPMDHDGNIQTNAGNIHMSGEIYPAGNGLGIIWAPGIMDYEESGTMRHYGFRTFFGYQKYLSSNRVEGISHLPGGMIVGGEAIVPTPLSGPEAANRAFVEAQVAASSGASNQVSGYMFFDGDEGITLEPLVTGAAYVTITNMGVGSTEGLVADGPAGKFTVSVDGEYSAFCTFSFEGGGNTIYNHAIATNDVHASGGHFRRKTPNNDLGDGGAFWKGPLSIGDTISCLVKEQSGGTVDPSYIEGSFYVERLVASVSSTNWSQWAATQNIDATVSVTTPLAILSNNGTNFPLFVFTHSSGSNALAILEDGNANTNIIGFITQ
jgi:hypothetical protein